LGSLVVGDAVGLDLLGRQVLGDVDGHLRQAELLRRLVAGMADYDHEVHVHDDRLAEAKLADGAGHGLDSVVVDARVLVVGPDVG
jgi:hypothetical protein